MEGLGTSNDLSVLSPAKIDKFAQILYLAGIRKFKIVGGEPTLRADLPQIIEGLRHLDPSIDISMVTNGVRLGRLASEYVAAGMDRINVSVFSLRPDYFGKHVGPISQMKKVADGVDTLVANRIPGKVNHVFHDLDDLLRVLRFARERNRRVNVLNEIPSMGSSSDGLPVGELWEILHDSLPITEVRIEDDPYSLPVRVLTLKDGSELEFKHLEIGSQGKFNSCGTCEVKSRCREGILALRLTTQGAIQPCMVRDDNCLNLKESPSTDALQRYLLAL